MLRHGPLPLAGYISTICEAFHCDPDRALQLDLALVSDVLEYRSAVVARDAAGDTKHGIDVFKKHPELLDLLGRMNRAQRGESLEAPGARAEGGQLMARYQADADDEE